MANKDLIYMKRIDINAPVRKGLTDEEAKAFNPKIYVQISKEEHDRLIKPRVKQIVKPLKNK